MAGENRTVLGKPDIGTAASLQTILYAIQNVGGVDRDFQMSVARLFSLLTKSHVGLSNVDNTSDANKPISITVQQALDTKADNDKIWPVVQVEGLENILLGKVDSAVFDLFSAAVDQALNDRVLSAAFTSAINNINTTLTQVTQDLAAMQANPYVTQSTFDTAMTNIGTLISQQITSAMASVNIDVSQITGLDAHIDSRIDNFTTANSLNVKNPANDW